MSINKFSVFELQEEKERQEKTLMSTSDVNQEQENSVQDSVTEDGRTLWVDNVTVIDAQKLNKIEGDIEELEQQAVAMAVAVDEFKQQMLDSVKDEGVVSSEDVGLTDMSQIIENLRQELYKNIMSKFVYPEEDDGLSELVKQVRNIKIDGSAGPEARVKNTISMNMTLENLSNAISQMLLCEIKKPESSIVSNVVVSKELEKAKASCKVRASLVRANMPEEIAEKLTEVQIGHYNRIKGDYFFRVAVMGDLVYLFASKDQYSLTAVNRNEESDELVFYADTNGIEYYDFDDPSPNMCISPNCIPYQEGVSLSEISELFQ